MYEYLCIYSIPHLLNIHALNVHTNARVKAQLIHTPKIHLFESLKSLKPAGNPRPEAYKTPSQGAK